MVGLLQYCSIFKKQERISKQIILLIMFLARGFQYIPGLDSTRGIKTMQCSIGTELLLFSFYPPHPCVNSCDIFLQNTSLQYTYRNDSVTFTDIC